MALACFAEEDHSLGLYGVALRFASWGFRSILLGPRTPPAAIASIVEALSPDVVALSVTTLPSLARGRELVDAYADACGATPWIVGGEAAPAVLDRVLLRGGLVASRDLTDLRRTLGCALAEKRYLATATSAAR